jgi:hypothetical protein
MALKNFRKESSERSDAQNWAKSMLARETDLFFESIEGCNQNKDNVVTHLFERMRVDYEEFPKSTLSSILEQIVSQEGKDSLQRKINFCKCFGLNLSYVLYCDEIESVYLFEFESIDVIQFKESFDSYFKFSEWIGRIKGWKSGKPFRENQDLPYFDKVLRKAGTAWPTNIDCFVCDAQSKPIGIIEFQNAKNTSVESHCNNDFFLCKFIKSNDIRRWFSQEILRVQSGLRLFVITWSQNEEGYKLKEIEMIIMPNFFDSRMNVDWDLKGFYESDLNKYVLDSSQEHYQKITQKYKSYSIIFDENSQIMRTFIHESALSLEDKTFPNLYYSFKNYIKDNKGQLIIDFRALIKRA